MKIQKIKSELKKFSFKTWEIIIGIAIIVSLIVGFFSLYDRFTPPKKTLPENKISEYVFGSKYYYVQALVSENNKVIAYSITTRDKNFNPVITILENAGCAHTKDISGFIPATRDIILGKTTFADLKRDQSCSYFDQPENIYLYAGIRRFYYHEEYYFGNPGNYQSYFFAINDSGFSNVTDIPQLFFGDQKVNLLDPEISKFRQNSIINTFQITSPDEGWGNKELRKYLAGVDYDQVRVIPEPVLKTGETANAAKIKLKKLSTEVNIQVFMNILGEPLVINNEPTIMVRDDKTLEEKFNDEYGEKN